MYHDILIVIIGVIRRHGWHVVEVWLDIRYIVLELEQVLGVETINEVNGTTSKLLDQSYTTYARLTRL